MPNIEMSRIRIETQNKDLIAKFVRIYKRRAKKGGAALWGPDFFKSVLKCQSFEVWHKSYIKGARDYCRCWVAHVEKINEEDLEIDMECAWSGLHDDSFNSFVMWLVAGIRTIDEDSSIEISSEVTYTY